MPSAQMLIFLLIHATMWMTLENMFSKRSQMQKAHIVCLHLNEMSRICIFRNRKQTGGGQEMGKGEMGSAC